VSWLIRNNVLGWHRALLVSLVALPWAVNLVSLHKPATALHPRGSPNLAGSWQGRGSSGDVSPQNTAVCIDCHMLPSLERTAVVQGYLEPHVRGSWASKGSAIRNYLLRTGLDF